MRSGRLGIFALLVAAEALQLQLNTRGTRCAPPLLSIRGGFRLPGKTFSAAERFARFDYDGDGTISADEFDPAADSAADRVSGTVSDPVILQFKPGANWLWRQWRGTVFEIVWPSVLFNIVYSGIVCRIIRAVIMNGVGQSPWPLFSTPDDKILLISRLSSINVMWTFLTSLCTFLITFFLGQCYSYWRTAFGQTRSIQGRFHDMNLQLASHAKRDKKTGRFLPASQELVDTVSRHTRLMHAFFWMTNDVSLSMLHDHDAGGTKRLVEKGLITPAELEVIIESGAPNGRRHNVVLTWIMARVAHAVDRGLTLGGHEFGKTFTDNACVLRAKIAAFTDGQKDRMPVAYIHIVQILIDSLLMIAPFALYPKVGEMCIPVVAMLTVFYRGLLEISKSFLDPFGNQGSRAQNINTDLLLAEVNLGSPFWPGLVRRIPVDAVSA